MDFVKQFMGATDFKSAAELILGCRAYEQTEHFVQTRGIDKEMQGAMALF